MRQNAKASVEIYEDRITLISSVYPIQIAAGGFALGAAEANANSAIKSNPAGCIGELR
jgi:hypothetical protein